MILPWQQHLWEHLTSYVSQKRVPQALLITGHKGFGKQQLAASFAESLLCSNPEKNGTACGVCTSCLLLHADTHPDFILVQPEEIGKSITVGQIRNLIAQLILKPQYEAHRVVIINPADTMNNAAANAFLKCLEEPTERTSIILITDKPAKLPATIISRCQKLTVAAPDKSVAINWLSEALKNKDSGTVLLKQADLNCYLSLAQGSPLLALDYINEQVLTLRNECFKSWLAIARQHQSPVVVAEDWHKMSGVQLIFWLTSWTVDLIKCFYHAQAENLYNADLASQLQELAKRLELRGLYKLYDQLLLGRQRLDTQINKQLLFEEILIHWHELNRRSK